MIISASSWTDSGGGGHYTEAQFIAMCNNGTLATTLQLGNTITLSNTYCSTYEVIGVNHDSTSGTVDIMPTTQVGKMVFSSSNNTYSTSSIRTWINNTYLSAFSSTIQSLAKTMSVMSATSLTAGTTIYDRVKILSAVELNVNSFHQYMPGYSTYKEGTAYTVFTAGAWDSAIGDRWRPAGSYGSSSAYWLRSRYTNSTYYVWYNSNGYIGSYDCDYSYGVLPVLRFGRSSVDPTKDTFTEAEFIEICNNNLCGQMHTGATITLNNTYCSTYEVIGVNHDSTTNSVDIMPTTQVGNMRFSDSDNTYSTSSIRTWINNTYLSAFSSTIQSLAKTMSVMSATSLTVGTTLSDKVKLLSAVELNLTTFNKYMPGYGTYKEGTAYTVFTAGACDSSISDRWRPAGTYGNSSYYWLRSRYTNSTEYVWLVNSNGSIVGYSFKYSRGVLPVLRF